MGASLLERWAASGLLALTGTPEVALGPPDGLIPGIERLGHRFADLDPLALLGERAALLGLGRSGAISCGGGCRLLPAADGWLAASLVRPDDMAAIAAWLERGPVPASSGAMWDAVAAAVATTTLEDLTARRRPVGPACGRRRPGAGPRRASARWPWAMPRRGSTSRVCAWWT